MPNINGFNPLSRCAGTILVEHLKTLIELECDPNIQDRFHRTPLMVTAWDGHADNLLVEAGADIDTKALQGNTAHNALHFALAGDAARADTLRRMRALAPRQWHRPLGQNSTGHHAYAAAGEGRSPQIEWRE